MDRRRIRDFSAMGKLGGGKNRKLTDIQARHIISSRMQGESANLLAERYGVSVGTIRQIIDGKSYKDCLMNKRTAVSIVAGKIASDAGLIRTPTLPPNLKAYKKRHPQWCFVVFRRAQAEKGMRHFLYITKRRAWQHAKDIAENNSDWFVSDCGRSIILDDKPWKNNA